MVQISPATSTTSNTPSLLDPTPMPAASPAVSRPAPTAAVDPFGIGHSNGGPPAGASSQPAWSPFGSHDSSAGQALHPGAGSGSAAYAPEGAPAWSAFDATTNGNAPVGQPVGGQQQQQQQQQPTSGLQQPSGVGAASGGGASWDPFSASGPPTPAAQPQGPAGQQHTAGPHPQQQQQAPQAAPTPPQQPTLQQAVLMAEQRAQQQAASQRQTAAGTCSRRTCVAVIWGTHCRCGWGAGSTRTSGIRKYFPSRQRQHEGTPAGERLRNHDISSFLHLEIL